MQKQLTRSELATALLQAYFEYLNHIYNGNEVSFPDCLRQAAYQMTGLANLTDRAEEIERELASD